MSISTVAALREIVRVVEGRIGPVQAPLGLVLGSGLGAVADEVEQARRLPYRLLPHFAPSTVPGHRGELVAGRWRGHEIVILSGRVHRYEGHDYAQVTLPVRLLGALGIDTVVVTNAAGSLHPGLQPGALMLISDHINLTGGNPLIGPNDERVGPRFPDMTDAYDPMLRAQAHGVAARLGLELHEGVYVGLSGPSYETPAEIRMLRALGGDAVGMSTVPEVIAARHMGLRVLGLSCITNLGAGLSLELLDHAHVGEVANAASARMIALLAGLVAELPGLPVRKRPF
jgi:purine-nucleoside phosphorylase